ncbi:MAG: thiamine-phosphate kinase [Saprospiraceae bacterium]|nr:thiamine-phosphate kinase [Candidatus Vicinibacter affinis]
MSRTEINTFGEFKLIEHLTDQFSIFHDTTLKGVGDDAAVLDLGAENGLLSTDLLIEGIHFDLMYFPLKHLGYKSVIVNLSDICAMNGIPQQITVSVAMSNRFSVEALEELYSGIKLACDLYKIDLIGGDTSSSQKGLIISISVFGRQAKEKVVYRSGAKSGDYIFTTGNLGGAYLGLQLLERERQLFLSDPNIKPKLEDHKLIVERFLKPEARKDIVLIMEKAGVIPTAMIDISDGLSSDLFHICNQSKVGALLEEANIPIHEEAQLMALEFNLDPVTCALNGGEDYELLMTVDPADFEKIRYLPGFYYIGEIKPIEEGIKIKTTGGNIHTLKAQGWQHF